MGVRGLSTYLKKDPANFTATHLHNTLVVIDGDNFVNWLYNQSELLHQYGGELLDAIAFGVQVLHQLSKCRIKPIFLFDGCHSSSGTKIDCLLRRSSDKLTELVRFQQSRLDRHADPDSLDPASLPQVLPKLLPSLFKLLLIELNQSILVCQREADSQLAELAIHFNCPVLTNDSDFFIFRLPPTLKSSSGGYCFIPLDSLSIDATLIDRCDRCHRHQNKPNRCFALPCSMFNFSSRSDFGSLAPSLLPLVAAMGGNDFLSNLRLPSRVMSAWKSQTSDSSLSGQGKKLRAIIQWLVYTQSCVSNFVDKTLIDLVSCQTDDIITKLSSCLLDYALDPTGSIGRQLAHLLSFVDQPQQSNLPSLSTQSNSFGPKDKTGVDRVKEALPALITSSQQLPACHEPDLFSNWPRQLIHCFLSGRLLVNLDPLFTKGGAVCRPLFEDVVNQASSCLAASLPLLDLLFGLLVAFDWPKSTTTDSVSTKLCGLKFDSSDITATYSIHTRDGSTMTRFDRIIQPISIDTSLSHLLSSRLDLTIPSDKPFLSPHLKGLVLLGVYWLRQSNQSPSSSSLYPAWLAIALVTHHNLQSWHSDSKKVSSLASCCHHYTELANWAKKKVVDTTTLSNELMSIVHQLNQLQCIIVVLDSLLNVFDCLLTSSPSNRSAESSRIDRVGDIGLWSGWTLLPSGRLLYWLSRLVAKGSQSQNSIRRMLIESLSLPSTSPTIFERISQDFDTVYDLTCQMYEYK